MTGCNSCQQQRDRLGEPRGCPGPSCLLPTGPARAAKLHCSDCSPGAGMCPHPGAKPFQGDPRPKGSISPAFPQPVLPAGSAALPEPRPVRERPWQGRGCGLRGLWQPHTQTGAPASPLTHSRDGSTSKAGHAATDGSRSARDGLECWGEMAPTGTPGQCHRTWEPAPRLSWSQSCTHSPREPRYPELLPAQHTFLCHSCCLQPLTKLTPRGFMRPHPHSSARSWYTLEVGFWVPLRCSITQASSISAQHGLLGPPAHPTGSECKVLQRALSDTPSPTWGGS